MISSNAIKLYKHLIKLMRQGLVVHGSVIVKNKIKNK